MPHYEESAFSLYCLHAYAHIKAAVAPDLDRKTHDEIERLSQRSEMALDVASFMFQQDDQPRPPYLLRLFAKLKRLEVDADHAACFCLMVEHIRVVTNRSATRPLIDRNEPKDPVVASMRYRLANKAAPLYSEMPEVPNAAYRWIQDMQRREALPIDKSYQSQILQEVFGVQQRGLEI